MTHCSLALRARRFKFDPLRMTPEAHAHLAKRCKIMRRLIKARFPTHGLLFSGLLVAVILIVGALTFFPALSLGPVAEHFVAAAGKVF